MASAGAIARWDASWTGLATRGLCRAALVHRCWQHDTVSSLRGVEAPSHASTDARDCQNTIYDISVGLLLSFFAVAFLPFLLVLSGSVCTAVALVATRGPAIGGGVSAWSVSHVHVEHTRLRKKNERQSGSRVRLDTHARFVHARNEKHARARA